MSSHLRSLAFAPRLPFGVAQPTAGRKSVTGSWHIAISSAYGLTFHSTCINLQRRAREAFLTGLQTTRGDVQMRRSEHRVITTHVGSLSRPPDLLALNTAWASGAVDAAAYGNGLAAAVTDAVKKQREVGIDIPNDGEFGKPMSMAYDCRRPTGDLAWCAGRPRSTCRYLQEAQS